jgi:protein-disulfide isomerase
MHCEVARLNIADYLTGTLAPEAEPSMLQHLEECASCRQEAAGLRALWEEMGDVSIPAPDQSSAQARFEAALAAFREPLVPPQTIFESLRRLYMRRPVLSTVVVGVMAVLLASGTAALLSREQARPAPKTASTVGGARIRGLESALVTLVQYGDYECPPCAVYNPIVAELVRKHPDWVKLEFHHFPLPVHPKAMAAAKAAEAAGVQGKYWEMHDLLLSRQQTWKTKEADAEFAKMAAEIGLDQDKYNEALKYLNSEQRIDEDLKRGRDAGVSGTPTFFVNGRRISDPPSTLEGFEALIVSELPRVH